MIRVLLKHIAAEVAINTLFDKLNYNFLKPKLDKLLRERGISSISDDIKFFERQRDKAHPSSRSRYNNMINTLKDAESVYYNTVKFGDLANEDSLITYPNPVRSTEKRIWKIDIDKHTTLAEHIVKLAEDINRRVRYNTKTGECTNY